MLTYPEITKIHDVYNKQASFQKQYITNPAIIVPESWYMIDTREYICKYIIKMTQNSEAYHDVFAKSILRTFQNIFT